MALHEDQSINNRGGVLAKSLKNPPTKRESFCKEGTIQKLSIK